MDTELVIARHVAVSCIFLVEYSVLRALELCNV